MKLSTLSVVCLVGGLLAAAPAPVSAQYGAAGGEWRAYAGDQGSTKYSPLDQIDASNFEDLRIAWRWQSADGALDLEALRERLGQFSIRGFQVTPLMIGGTLYLSTALYQVAALDAGTGEVRWVYDPRVYDEGLPTHGYGSRGIAYWADEESDDERIFWGTSEGWLHAVDAKTGRPVPGFGAGGRVDLTEGIPRADRGDVNYQGRNLLGVKSPPVVMRDVVVTPTIISDFVIRREAPPGWVKGIDARTGDTRWVFRTVPQADDFGADTWLNESWRYSGNANIWPPMSGDEETGYVFLPTGTPTSDYYGGHRPGDNLFAESIVAVAIETGQRMWHFQAVHHGVWDYDFPARADPRRHHRRRTARQGPRASEQAGVHLRLRPGDRRPGVAHRGASGRDRHRPRGRGALADAAVPDEAAPVRVPGHRHRRSGRLHPGDPGPRGRGGPQLPARTALHPADAQRRGRPAGHDSAAPHRGRGELERGRRRPRDGAALRPFGEPLLGHQVLHARPRRGRQPALYAGRLRQRHPARHAPGPAAAQAAVLRA